MCPAPGPAPVYRGRVIEVRGLTKRYGSVLAVDDLSFDVRPGRVTGFLGPNGSGKSTTMRMMLDLDRPDAGTATFGGRPYRRIRQPMREVGALLDAGYVHPTRSARNHLRSLALMSGVASRRVDEVLAMVGLTEVADKRVGGFSLGMHQRLGLAVALLGDPGVLLFDEPVNGLDPEGISWVRQFMQRLAAEGRTVLVSSHLLSEMSLTAADLVVIGRGRLIAQGSVADFIARSSTSWVEAHCPRAAELAQLVQQAGGTVSLGQGALTATGMEASQVGELAAHYGIALHQLVTRRPSLEEAFLEVTRSSQQFSGTEGAFGAVPGGATGPTTSPHGQQS